ncbi:MAG: 3-oxoacyl-ACP reductase FabG [Neisseriales bacterium]|nr:MAG: 3-oxoacyl-ACP reductase FabG [Neisseriales bacterium]
MLLRHHVALVTGASRGIGAACAKVLADNGAVVIGTATTQAGALAIQQQLAHQNGAGEVLDVTQPAAITQLVDALLAQYEHIDILVNNAGITRDALLMRMKEIDWLSVIQTNLTSAFLLSQAVLRSMVKTRFGRIINISSVVGATGNAGQTNYAASKAGLIGLTKSLAREVGSRGITVNCIAPGFINTKMTQSLSDEQRALLMKNIVLGRFGEADDIAQAVLFLASPHASYITGQTLHVNGGMLMS